MKKNIKKFVCLVAVVSVLTLGAITIMSGPGGVEPDVGTVLSHFLFR